MGLEGVREINGPAGWQEPGLGYFKHWWKELQPAAGSPTPAETPQEARAHIDVLYKSGRMSEVAGLLRQSQVFREAWLSLQQSTRVDLPAVVVKKGAESRSKTGGGANLPVALGQAPERRPSLQSGATKFTGAEEGFSLPVPVTRPVARAGAPTGTPAHLLQAALKAYRSQDRHYQQERNPEPRLSLKA